MYAAMPGVSAGARDRVGQGDRLSAALRAVSQTGEFVECELAPAYLEGGDRALWSDGPAEGRLTRQVSALQAADLVRLTRAQVADICREAPEAG
jgi:hypothetical protein